MASGAKIILLHTQCKSDEFFGDDGSFIDNFSDGFELIGAIAGFGELDYDAFDVVFAPAEGDLHTHTNANFRHLLGGDGVIENFIDIGDYDFGNHSLSSRVSPVSS